MDSVKTATRCNDSLASHNKKKESRRGYVLPLASAYESFKDGIDHGAAILFRSIQARAGLVLGESRDEFVGSVLKALEELLSRWQCPEITGVDTPVDPASDCPLTPVAALFLRRHDEEIRAHLGNFAEDLPKVFGALGLGFLAVARQRQLHAHNLLSESKKPDSPKGTSELVSSGTCVAHALESVACAERLAQYESELRERVRAEIRNRQVKGGQVRHAKIANLKAEFASYYANGKFQSKADAARRFIASIPAEKKAGFSEYNLARTLREALPAD